MHGKIWGLEEEPDPEPQLHLNCRCVIEHMETILAGTATANGIDGADWTLKYTGDLPDYYITKDAIKALGWQSGKAPSDYAPGSMVTAGEYRNRNGHLPEKAGRIWYEADINYVQGPRNTQRVVFCLYGRLLSLRLDRPDKINKHGRRQPVSAFICAKGFSIPARRAIPHRLYSSVSHKMV